MAKQNWKPGNMLYPLPAVMVSCQSSTAHDPLCERPELDGKPNIITVAWAGTVCTNPPMVSISVRPERYSYHLIEESGEFVINLTTEKLVKATDYCGVRSGRDVDKFKEMHLTPLASKHIHAPGIVESPVVSANGVPELAAGERIQVVYNEMEQTDEGVIIDIVYAIYKENDLEGTQEK